MTKRSLMVLVLVVITVGGAYALPNFRFSMGAGGYFMIEMGGGVEASYRNESYSVESYQFGFGGFAFLDFTFVELSLGFFKAPVFQINQYVNRGFTGDSIELNATGLDIGLMLKYPFRTDKKVSLYPLLGVNYRYFLSANMNDNMGSSYVNEDYFTALWFNLGGGLDISFTDRVYLRGELLHGIRLENDFEKELEYDMKQPGSEFSDPRVRIEPTIGHGPQLKIAIGFRI
jgi:hypothetical protein